MNIPLISKKPKQPSLNDAVKTIDRVEKEDIKQNGLNSFGYSKRKPTYDELRTMLTLTEGERRAARRNAVKEVLSRAKGNIAETFAKQAQAQRTIADARKAIQDIQLDKPHDGILKRLLKQEVHDSQKIQGVKKTSSAIKNAVTVMSQTDTGSTSQNTPDSFNENYSIMDGKIVSEANKQEAEKREENKSGTL